MLIVPRPSFVERNSPTEREVIAKMDHVEVFVIPSCLLRAVVEAPRRTYLQKYLRANYGPRIARFAA